MCPKFKTQIEDFKLFLFLCLGNPNTRRLCEFTPILTRNDRSGTQFRTVYRGALAPGVIDFTRAEARLGAGKKSSG